jgi:hypothetical protein
MSTNNDNRGRTFWDLIAEHPKMSFYTIIFLILAVVFLVWNRYSIKSSVFSIEPEKSIVDKSKDTVINPNITRFDTLPLNNKKIKSYKQVEYVNPPRKTASRNDTIKANVVNVTSTHQSGGITANQVNIGAVPRKFDLETGNRLLNLLKNKNEKIEVSSVMGDSESFSLANNIFDFLKSNGFKNIDGVNQSAFSRPVFGQYLDRDSTGVKILIGSNPIK